MKNTTPTPWKNKKHTPSWWFQPIWKILVKLETFPNFRGENSKNIWVATTETPLGSRVFRVEITPPTHRFVVFFGLWGYQPPSLSLDALPWARETSSPEILVNPKTTLVNRDRDTRDAIS